MATISVSSLLTAGQRVAKYCRAILAFDSLGVRPGGRFLSFAFGSLMTVVEANYGRIASSIIRALSDARPSAGLLLCLAFNILFIAGGAVLCLSGYGVAAGLSIVVLALAPALMPLNIALFAWVDEGWQSSPLRAVSSSSEALQRGESFDEKNPSLVPEASETASAQSVQPSLQRRSLRSGPAARRKIAKWMKVQG